MCTVYEIVCPCYMWWLFYAIEQKKNERKEESINENKTPVAFKSCFFFLQSLFKAVCEGGIE